MGLINAKTINFTDIIEFLSSGGNISSPLGSMLDKIRDGTSGVGSSGVNNEEFNILSKAAILKCVDGLRKIDQIKFESCPSIRAFAKKTNSGEGSLVLSVLASYHKWHLRSEERGLVEVYRLMQKLDPSLPEPDHDEDSLSQSFRTGKTKKARDGASKLLKDSILVIDTWIKEWNECVKRDNRSNVTYLSDRKKTYE